METATLGLRVWGLASKQWKRHRLRKQRDIWIPSNARFNDHLDDSGPISALQTPNPKPQLPDTLTGKKVGEFVQQG